MEYREYLANRRKELGLTQAEVAQRMGHGFQSQVSELESGTTPNPTVQTLEAWAAALDLGLSIQFTEPVRRTFTIRAT